MPQLDPSTFPTQLFWLAIVFVMLLIMMSWIGLPGVRKAIDARTAKIDGDLAAAAAARGRSTALLAEYEKSLAQARAEAQSTLRAIEESMVKERARRDQDLFAQLAIQARSAEARIAAAKTAALADVEQIAIGAVQAATAHLVGEPPPRADVAAAVASVLAERP
jgi:F-type H+-transporting ATPase subunit b